MAFQCLDCSYKASKKFPGGRCPACDSFNVKGKKKELAPEVKKRKTIGEIIIMILLWGTLIYGAWDTHIKDMLL